MRARDGDENDNGEKKSGGGALLFRGLGEGRWRPPTVCQTPRTMNTLGGGG